MTSRWPRVTIRLGQMNTAMWLWIAVGVVIWLFLLLLSATAFRLTLYGIFAVPTFLLLQNIDWSAALTPLVLLKIFGLLFCVSNIVSLVRRSWRLWNGLDQWPSPEGRFYEQWTKLPAAETHSDYYEWLAQKKGGDEPWASWAKMEREL
jgi:hypothetical protein